MFISKMIKDLKLDEQSLVRSLDKYPDVNIITVELLLTATPCNDRFLRSRFKSS